MKVAFHSNTLGFRGSEQALWDYANLNESILGNQSVIFFPARPGMEVEPAYKKWRSRFPLYAYGFTRDLRTKLVREGAEALYMLKPGPFDGKIVQGIKNCVHAMFLTDEYHGDAFAYVSRWASHVMTGTEKAYVPHFVPTFSGGDNLRKKLGISQGARVFGRHGAADTFNIPFAQRAVLDHAQKHPEDHFVFLNTRPFQRNRGFPNIHHLPPTDRPEEKAAFLATCDAMLHARWHGETFGLAVGEFAVLGKPVITYGASRERAHLDALGAKARIYHDREELLRILEDFQPCREDETLYSEYARADHVMEKFRDVFLPNKPLDKA
ncbi:hypothetical protein EBX31_00180 [bacterium]|nr:hypothetical protein [bacterium]